MPVTSYKMKTNGATLGRVSNTPRSWKPGQVYQVPADVPEGEFDHLGGGDYEATVVAEPKDPNPDENQNPDENPDTNASTDPAVQTRPAKGTTRPAK